MKNMRHLCSQKIVVLFFFSAYRLDKIVLKYSGRIFSGDLILIEEL